MLTPLLLALAVIGAPPRSAPAPPPPQTDVASAPTYRVSGTRLAVAQDIHIGSDEEVRDAVAVFGGSAYIDGRVRDGVLVVGGDLHLSPTAEIRGDVMIVGGVLVRDPAARLLGSVSYVSVGDWSRRAGLSWWQPRRDWGETGRWLGLVFTSLRVLLLGCLMVGVLLVARAPVARIGRAAAAAPFRAALVGLAAEVLFLPVLIIASVALGLTIIGLPIVFLAVPLVFLTALFALLLGYTALACRIGEWCEDRFGWRPQSAYVATFLGFLIIVLPTLAARVLGIAPEPLRAVAFSVLMAGAIAEFVVWTIGLGATLLTGFGRWNLVPPPIDVES